MRWYSLNGVPRGSKNGSGAIMRIFMKSQFADGRTTDRRDSSPALRHPASRPEEPENCTLESAFPPVSRTPSDSPSPALDRQVQAPDEPRSRSLLLPFVKLLVSAGLIAVLLSRIDGATLWRTAR